MKSNLREVLRTSIPSLLLVGWLSQHRPSDRIRNPAIVDQLKFVASSMQSDKSG